MCFNLYYVDQHSLLLGLVTFKEEDKPCWHGIMIVIASDICGICFEKVAILFFVCLEAGAANNFSSMCP